MEVAVIQYLRPDGRTRNVTTTLPDSLHIEYLAMLELGYNFAAEELTTGEVSVTIEDRAEGEDIDIRIVPNGPEVQKAMGEMLSALSGRQERHITGCICADCSGAELTADND